MLAVVCRLGVVGVNVVGIWFEVTIRLSRFPTSDNDDLYWNCGSNLPELETLSQRKLQSSIARPWQVRIFKRNTIFTADMISLSLVCVARWWLVCVAWSSGRQDRYRHRYTEKHLYNDNGCPMVVPCAGVVALSSPSPKTFADLLGECDACLGWGRAMARPQPRNHHTITTAGNQERFLMFSNVF